MATKIEKFEYMVHKFIAWYNELNNSNDLDTYEDFSKLKLIKLHFFVCAITTRLDKNHEEGLLRSFDNFYAMPYGHVESDVYSRLKDVESIEINNTNIRVLNKCPDKLCKEEIEEIDKAVAALKSENIEIINYNASRLVNLSHEWNSWQTSYSIAQNLNKASIKIPISLIVNEPKFYSL